MSRLYRDVLAATSRLSAGAGSGADTGADVGVGSCSSASARAGAGASAGAGAGVDAAIDAAASPLPIAAVAKASAEKTSRNVPLNHHSITAIEKQQQASKDRQQATFTSSGSRSKKEIEIPVEAIEESRPDLAWAMLTAEIWHKLMRVNPNSDPAKIPSKWESLWAKDFMDLSAHYTRSEISDMIALSQSPSQEKFYVRPSILLEKAEKLTKDIDYIKRQKTGAGWRIVVDCLKKKMAKVNQHPVPVEKVAFLDEPSFNIDGDEDELA